MEMLFATWVLVAFAGILAVATWKYAKYTKQMIAGSEKQLSAFGRLTRAIDGLKEIKEPLENLRIAVKNLPSAIDLLGTAEMLAEEHRQAMGVRQRFTHIASGFVGPLGQSSGRKI